MPDSNDVYAKEYSQNFVCRLGNLSDTHKWQENFYDIDAMKRVAHVMLLASEETLLSNKQLCG